jgi:hypothetical protein
MNARLSQFPLTTNWSGEKDLCFCRVFSALPPEDKRKQLKSSLHHVSVINLLLQIPRLPLQCYVCSEKNIKAKFIIHSNMIIPKCAPVEIYSSARLLES